MKKKIILIGLIIVVSALVFAMISVVSAAESAQNTNEVVQRKQVGEKEKWKHTFTLPKYDENGKLIKYELDEENISEGYSKKVNGNTITNTLNKYNYRVEYYYDGKIDESKTDVVNVSYGTIITAHTDKRTNGYKLEKEEGMGLKVGINEKDNIIKVFYVTETTTYSGTKEWRDDNNSQNLRPKNYNLKLYANGKFIKEQNFTNETWEFTALQKYDYVTGKQIIYTVQEDEIILKNGDRYVPTIDKNKVINTLTGTTTIEAQKIWEDNENKNKTRPENITLIIKKILTK